MLEGEERKYGGGNSAPNDFDSDPASLNPSGLVEWVKGQEHAAKQVARHDPRYGEASLTLTYTKELLALLEFSTAASAMTRSDDATAINLEVAAEIASLVQRIAEVRAGAESVRQGYSGRPVKRIR